MSGIGSMCSTSRMRSMANGDAVGAQRRAATEGDLWRAHLAVLSHDLRARKPDGVARLRSEAARLDREVEALMARQKLAERAAGSQASATLEQLTEAVADRLRRVSDLAGLTRTYGGKPRLEDVGPNAEAAVRPAAIDPIELLFGKGKLTEDQYRAAREIAWVYEAITRAGRARISRLSQIEAPKGWQEVPLPERAAFVHAKRFVPWAQRLEKESPATLDIVLRLAVFGAAVYPVARKHRLSWNTCVARLGEGLDRYWRRSVGGRD